MVASKNSLKLVLALLFLLGMQQFVTHKESVYYNLEEDDTNRDTDHEHLQVNTKSDPAVLTHYQTQVDHNNDNTNNDNTRPVLNAESDLDSTNKATYSDDPQVITTITPPSQVLFPYPKITRQPQEILNSPWATKMKVKLEAAKVGKQLTYVTVSMNYISVLINWLIHAKLNALPLMENLLVVCMDKPSCEVLSRKGILSHLVKINDIIYSINDMEGSTLFSARVITRLTVLRLLNYLGYDVLVMDIDALLINNPQPIFDHYHDSDIIVSTANAKNCLPYTARNAWGFCLCIGLLLIRGNANTGMYVHPPTQTHTQTFFACPGIFFIPHSIGCGMLSSQSETKNSNQVDQMIGGGSRIIKGT